MSKIYLNWLLFIILSLIWGSSFILMKIGLLQLSPYQVAAIRIVTAGLVLLPVTVKHIRSIATAKVILIFLSGTIGSLLPAFLFCIAEEQADSSLAGTLNALTPVFVLLTGVLFFKTSTSIHQIIGVAIALTGTTLLLASKSVMQITQNIPSALLVVLATFLYGFNVNMVSKKLLHIPSLQITAIALSFNAIPAFLILVLSGFFRSSLLNSSALTSILASVVLGIGGTAIATVIFYVLVKRAGVVFASLVTYAIPFVATGWGIYYGEDFGWWQVACMLIILAGVYYTRKK